jgi:putative serine/threonine protein kinase
LKKKVKMHESIYEVEEDSKLLLNSFVNDNPIIIENKKICEMGIGSGFILERISKKYKNNSFYGFDINPYAVEESKKKIENLSGETSDLFEKSKTSYDYILFNTPYLPLEKGENYERLNLKEKAIYGGKKGYEIIEKFILQLNDNLENQGFSYMLFSSLSDKKKIEEILNILEFEWELISEKEVGMFEILYVFKIKKSEILKKLTSLKIKNIKYLAMGKHSKVLEGKKNNREIVVKISKEEYVHREVFFNEKLEKLSFVNPITYHDKNFFIREKINGIILDDVFDKFNKKEIVKIFFNIIEACIKLDELGINKFEMTNPYKHVFIQENLEIKMIDFERCTFNKNPKNTRQFLSYVRRNIENFKKIGIAIKEKNLSLISQKIKKNNVIDDKIKVSIKEIFS